MTAAQQEGLPAAGAPLEDWKPCSKGVRLEAGGYGWKMKAALCHPHASMMTNTLSSTLMKPDGMARKQGRFTRARTRLRHSGEQQSCCLHDLLPLEPLLLHESLELFIVVLAQVELLLLLALVVEKDQDRIVVGNEIQLQSHVGISIPELQDELPDLGQLVQASSRARPDLALPLSALLPLEALILHQPVNLVTSEAAQVQPLLLLPVLVEEDQIGIVVRDKVDLQSLVGVSVARLFDEPAGFR
jgi:hypothetical protein